MNERIYIHSTREFGTVHSWTSDTTCIVITCPVLGEPETREINAAGISFVHWSSEHEWPFVVLVGSTLVAAVLFGLEIGCERDHSISAAVGAVGVSIAAMWSYAVHLARRECES